MDAAEEIPHLVRPEKEPRVDGDAPWRSPAQAAAIAKVLDDDNLLREIIVRVGFPTTLVRAALVCKRWLGHASDPKFLSRFRKLHPTRLLGYYIVKGVSMFERLSTTRFVPILPQPPELAAVIRRLESYNFGAHNIMHWRNGSFFTIRHTGTKWTLGMHHPLCAQKGIQIVPPLPPIQDHNRKRFSAIVSKEEVSGSAYFFVLGESTGEAGKTMVRVYMLQDGAWHVHTSATCFHRLNIAPEALLVDNKIYMPTASGDEIIVLDLTASSFYTIQLPEGVKYRFFRNMLSRTDYPSSVYLIHVEKFQLHVWLHKGDNWLLVDTICLHEMFATLGISDHTLENEDIANVQIRQVGDNGQFVFLRTRQCMFYLDIKCKTLCKVYEKTANDQCCGVILPFMMIWPPTFPALKDDPTRMVSDGQ